MQLVVAINPNEMFLLRDMRGRSRYDNINQAIQQWVAAQPAPQVYKNKVQPENPTDLSKMNGDDDLSLISSNGIEITHASTYADWLKGFNSLPLEKPFKLNFDILVKAIDMAIEKSPRDGMGRAVFLITAPPDKEDASAFDNLITHANEQRVHVFVWMISSPGYFSSQGAIG